MSEPLPPTVRLDWNPAWRVIPSRYPAIDVFEHVASAEDFDALYALEALTNDRLRDEVGQIELVPRAERVFGPGSGPIMAAFTHRNPLGSRFSDGSYGVFYCARETPTAIAETAYHSARFLAATGEAPLKLSMRLYSVTATGEVADLRAAALSDAAILDFADYRSAQALGRRVREAGVPGLVYPSVRHDDGQCLAAFSPRLIGNCRHSAYLEYRWNGRAIEAVFEFSRIA